AAGDLTRQAFNLIPPRLRASAAAQAVAAGVAACPRAAGRGFRTRAVARVATVGGDLSCARHQASAAVAEASTSRGTPVTCGSTMRAAAARTLPAKFTR